MIFKETRLPGAYIVALEKREDNRGFFARAFCGNEFEQHGLEGRFVQANISYNHRRGTLRGMHYQIAPCEEGKLVRCTSGAIYDVIIDVRPESPTYKEWMGVELTADSREMLYVPGGCAHGFETLVDRTEVFYLVTAYYAPECERGIRFDDEAFGISWPVRVEVISEKDRNWPNYTGCSQMTGHEPEKGAVL